WIALPVADRTHSFRRRVQAGSPRDRRQPGAAARVSLQHRTSVLKKGTREKGQGKKAKASRPQYERAGALSRRGARSARRQRQGVGPQAHQEKWGPASSNKR